MTTTPDPINLEITAEMISNSKVRCFKMENSDEVIAIFNENIDPTQKQQNPDFSFTNPLKLELKGEVSGGKVNVQFERWFSFAGDSQILINFSHVSSMAYPEAEVFEKYVNLMLSNGVTLEQLGIPEPNPE